VLSPKQERFVREYLKDLNATKAAERAGYSKRTARAQGSLMLTNVDIATAIQQGKAKRAKRVEIEADDVLRELGCIAFGNVTDLVEVSDTGDVRVRPLHTLRPRVQRSVESITQTRSERLSPDGGDPLETVQTKVKMHSKIAALRMLMDHLGMDAPKKTEQGNPGDFGRFEKMSQAELEAEAKARAKKLLSGG
jgi:phage terminase small subunit